MDSTYSFLITIMTDTELKNILEAALLATERPLTLDNIIALFPEEQRPAREQVRDALDQLRSDYEPRGIELAHVASGYRIQVKDDLEPWISRLWEERPPRYSRALLETLALIAYRQPITRAEIEDVRGVSVSSSIMKTLQEREWIRIVGHKDVPGRPGMYATTRQFLDYFNLKTLEDLPSLLELQDLDSMNAELDLVLPEAREAGQAQTGAADAAVEQAPESPIGADALDNDGGGEGESHTTLH